MAENKIKKIKDRIYQLDFSNVELEDGNEMVINNGVSEFVMALRKRDLDKGIIVTPTGYTSGLVYKSANDGEFYNNPSWMPDIVTFALNVYGLKKGAFYKLTVEGRNTGSNNVITTDRSIHVHNEDKELIIDSKFENVSKNEALHGIFRTFDNETNLFFSIGKIFISDIIIEEIEILSEESEEIDQPTEKLEEGKIQLAAFGVFTTQPDIGETYKGRYIPMIRYTGKGINLYFDQNENQYVIERDNANDVLGESFTNLDYLVDFNFNKVVNKDLFVQYNIVDVSPDISPNTLKQGYIKFEFTDELDKPVVYTNRDGRMAILIYKLF